MTNEKNSAEPESQPQLSEEEKLVKKHVLKLEEVKRRLELWGAMATGDEENRVFERRKILSLSQIEFDKLEAEHESGTSVGASTDEQDLDRVDGEGMIRRPTPEAESLPELKPEPEQIAQPEPVPASPPDGETGSEVSQYVRQLQEQFPERYKKVVTFDRWKNGDAASREMIARQVIETSHTRKPKFAKELAERFPGIYRKLETADGWNRLHPDTRESIVGAFMTILNEPDGAWAGSIFKDRLGSVILEITASEEQLKQPRKIKAGTYSTYIDMKQHGESVHTDGDGNIVIPVYFAGEAAPDDQNQLSMEIAGLLPQEYSPEWSAGRLSEIQNTHPEVYLKLISAEHWSELNEETKDMLAEAFMLFLEQYPDRILWIAGESARGLSILLTDDATQNIRAGKPLLLERVIKKQLDISIPATTILVVASADAVVGRYDFSRREWYVQHARETLRGLRP